MFKKAHKTKKQRNAAQNQFVSYYKKSRTRILQRMKQEGDLVFAMPVGVAGRSRQNENESLQCNMNTGLLESMYEN